MYLKEVLCRRLSLQKAEERKRAEEMRKMDNEELEPGNLSELEAELSDEEFEDELDSSEEEEEDQGENKENGDLGEKEEEANSVLSDSSVSNSLVEESCSSGDSGQSDSDDGDDDVLPVSRRLNFSLRKSRVIDSDDELHCDTASTKTGPQSDELEQEQSRLPVVDNHTLVPSCESSGNVLDQRTTVIARRQPSVFSEEASQGPLVFGGSSVDGSEVSDTRSHDQVEQVSDKATIFQGVCLFETLWLSSW